MNFLDAVYLIKNNPKFRLCDNEDEINGIRSCICVYKETDEIDDSGFIGKLRWPKDGKPAEVDEELINALMESKS
jgi:hypothetical protein